MVPHRWFDRLPRPAIIAHRGASEDAPENTLAAFRLAVSQGADAVELDVDLCAGGELVVIHDSTVDRTTNGTGKVAALSLQALRELDAGSWFDAEYAGEKIPTLDEVFETVGRQVFINVELKNYTKLFDRLAEQAARCVLRHDLTDRVFFSSFNPLNFRRIKRLLPDSPVGLLTFKGAAAGWMTGTIRRIAPYDALHPNHRDATLPLRDRCRKAGLPFFPYTANEAPDIRRLLDLGSDGVITDNPSFARSLLRSLQP